MLQHQVEGFLARLLAQVGEQSDVASHQRLQAGTDGSENRTRAHHDASHDTERARHAEAVEFKLGGHHIVGHHPASAVACCHCGPSFRELLTIARADNQGEYVDFRRRGGLEFVFVHSSWAVMKNSCDELSYST